ncbi:MAG: hypothetical protein CK425_01480 [Parachlamydia sp.]|nr:MAG: hypothetical protein CK425_01480 [Parachlamydia sp.]
MFHPASLLNSWRDFASSALQTVQQAITEIPGLNVFHGSTQTKNIPELPLEVFFHIFSFLPPKDLGRATSVCWTWKELIESDQRFKNILALQALKGLYPSIRFYDETIWEKHADLSSLGLEVNDIEPIHKETFIEEVNTLKNLGVEETQMMVVTIPKNATISKIIEFAKKPLMGNSTEIEIINNPLTNEIPVEKTFRVLFICSKDFLKYLPMMEVNARDPEAQQTLSLQGYEIPQPLVSTALAILMYVSSPVEKNNFLVRHLVLISKTHFMNKAKQNHLLYLDCGKGRLLLSGGGNHKVLD